MTIEDLNGILYAELSAANLGLSGGIYFDNERPLDSKLEDIAINTPALNGMAGHPQNGYSNLNIYVPQMREKDLVEKVTAVVENMQVEGVNYVESERKEQSADGGESFVNVRVFWNIYYL